jgi:ferritin-like metal-binding protein YciE
MDAEDQLTEALPMMAEAASTRGLKQAFQKHLKETENHVKRLRQAMQRLGEEPESKTCDGMKGLLEEAQDMMGKTPEGPLRDAVMITGAQKVEHYEMASYGTARTYADVLGEREVARLLEQTLKEEKAADLKLTEIAEGSVNEQAAQQWSSQSEQGEGEAGLMARAASWVSGGGASKGSRQGQGGSRRATANNRSSRSRSNSRGSSRSSSGSRRRTSSKRSKRSSR